MRFIELVSSSELTLHNKSRKELVAALAELEFTPEHKLSSRSPTDTVTVTGSTDNEVLIDDGEAEAEVEGEADGAASLVSVQSYAYLLNMSISSLTRDRIVSLKAELSDISAQHAELERTDLLDMWERELDALATEVEKLYAADLDELMKYLKKTFNGQKPAKTPRKRAKKGVAEAEASVEDVQRAEA